MALKITREGVGWGAQKQFHLLRPYWDFDAVRPQIVLYWNSFTRDFAQLERRKERGTVIVSRVGGWHFNTAADTLKVLSMSDGAIFVSKYTQRLAERHFGDRLPKRQIVIPNSVPQSLPIHPMADPPYLLVRAGGLGWPIWKRHMLCRSLSVTALWKVWPALRERHPNLGLKIVGKADRNLKEHCSGDGIEYIEYISDEAELHELGGKAAALVHLVVGDHSPNTVCEIVGEGRSAIVPDRGGARELAGRAGIPVAMMEKELPIEGETGDTKVWWPLDKKTYSPSALSLLDAVDAVLEDPGHWRKQARKRAGELEPKETAAKYLKFMESCAE